MRELDLVEQEELAKLKSIWHEYGIILITGAIVFLGVYGGTRYWNYHQRDQAVKAAYIYETYLEKINEGESEAAKELVARLTNEFESTSYASIANLQQAKQYYLAKNISDQQFSLNHLQWVIENGNDELFRDSARLQLMQLLINDKKYQQAIEIADQQESSTMAMGILELKGDCYSQLGKFDQAMDAYKQSIYVDIVTNGKLGQTANPNPIVTMKIQSLPK